MDNGFNFELSVKDCKEAEVSLVAFALGQNDRYCFSNHGYDSIVGVASGGLLQHFCIVVSGAHIMI